MAVTQNSYTGNGSTTNYSFTFPYLQTSDVKCSLDAVVTTAFTLANATTVQFNTAPGNGVKIKIYRETADDNLTATFYAGSSIKSEDLNDNFTQNLYTTQEVNARFLSNLGGTMVGNLTMDEDADIIFEGATANAHETTLTVADPTADRTITLPNVTGTVVTTGDTGTVTSTMIADATIAAGDLASNAVTTAKITDSNVTTAKIADDAITQAKIADDAVGADQLATNAVTNAAIAEGTIINNDINASADIAGSKLADGSIATAKIADDAVTQAKLANNSVGSAQILDGNITTAKIADANVTTVKIGAGQVTLDKLDDNSVNTARIIDGNVTTAKLASDAVTTVKIADNNVTTAKIADSNVTTAKIAADAVTTAKIAHDSITWEKIADDSIRSEHYTDGSIDTAHIAAAQVTDTKLASNAVTTAKITDANVTTAKVADDAITIAKIGCEQTTISDSDSHIPTSGAVVDYVAAQIAPIGGLEVIADEDNFPSTQPSAGVVISIADAGGVVVNGSGVSTTARTAGNGSDNVTINGFPSDLQSTTLAASVGLMVTSTGSGNTYNYHKALLKEADLKNLSNDIDDFGNRYRVHAGEPSSNNDDGDLVWDTNADKMKVYDATASAWTEVTSTGEFKYLFLCPNGGSGAPTLNGSIATYDLRESSNSGSAASVTNAAQLIVSINGVVQKANTGTSAPAEGFALADANTIVFGENLASGDSVFIVQIGSAVSIPTPGDGTVSAAKIASGAVTTAKIADANVTLAKMAANSVSIDQYVDGSIAAVHLSDNAVTTNKLNADAVTGAKIADDAIDSEHYTDGSVDHVHLAADCVDGDNIQDDVINSEHIAAGAVDLEHMSSESVDEDNLYISNAGSNGQYLQKQSGNSGGLTWADVSTGVTSDAQRNTVAGTNAGDSFDGTEPTDNTLLGYDAGTAITSGDHNVAIGSYALDANTTGYGHTAVGKGALTTNNTGYKNTGIGEGAANGNTTGNENTAVGYRAGYTNETGSSNTAIGAYSLYATTGQGNTALGGHAGYSLGTGTNNTILGQSCGQNLSTAHHSVYVGQTCGFAITTGYQNTAIGALAFKETAVDAYANVVIGYNAGTKIDGNSNTVVGSNAHVFGTTCGNNVAIGADALKGSSGNTTGDNNTCVGTSSGFAITTGGTNTLLGSMAGYAVTTGTTNTIVGREAGKGVTTGQDNVLLGGNAGNYTNILTTGQKNVIIGNYSHTSAVDGDYQTVIGYNLTGKGDSTSFIYGACYQGNNSSSWSTTSDRRIKKNIVDNNDGLSKINSIRVRNFEYRTFDEITELDNPAAAVVEKEGTQLGVIAQEIMEVLPDVVKQESTGAYSVNPDNLTWYLVNAVKELSAKVTELEAKVNG